MATFHNHLKSISRGHGRNAMAAAAYRSCADLVQTIYDQESGLSFNVNHNYSNKIGLAFSQIMADNIAPEWVYDRQKLWQRIEDIEGRVNSELAKEFEISLPVELTEEQNKDLLKEFVLGSLVARGMVVDVNFHNDNPENPHAHIMFPMRSLEASEGGEIDFGKKRRDWKNVSMLRAIRQEQSVLINHHLELHGYPSRVSHLSHEQRGIDLVPGVHEGPAKWMKNAELRQLNHDIAQANAARIIANPSLIIDKLSIDKPVFTVIDIEQELYKTLMVGINPSMLKDGKVAQLEIIKQAELVQMLKVVLASPRLTVVNYSDLKNRMLFAKTDRLELEARFTNQVQELIDNNSHKLVIKPSDIGTIEAGKTFTAQQQQAIISVLAGANISVLEGWPGAGKTTVMREIARQYHQAGYKVIGTTPTNKAATELAAKTGIEVLNTTKLRQMWQAERGYQSGLGLNCNYYRQESYQDHHGILNSKTVLIIDEASMLDLPTLDYYLAEAIKSNIKIIALGDNNQNPAIGYKGGFSKIGDIAGRSLLTEINRHQNQDKQIRAMHIEATQAMGRYDIAKALSLYDGLGMIKIYKNEDEKQAALVDAYVLAISSAIDSSALKSEQQAFRSMAIAAYTNREVDSLNADIRSRLKNSGILKGSGNQFQSGSMYSGRMVELCLGEQIIFKSNQVEFEGYGGVQNNDIAIVSRIITIDQNGSGVGEFEALIRHGQNGYRTVKIKTGGEQFPIHFKHGYALTGHAVQGASVDQFFYSVDKHSGYEAFNVGTSRHILNCQIFAAQDTLENEVLKTKDLDVAKVREEFRAHAYKYIENDVRDNINNSDNKGKNNYKSVMVDVPLWQVGLKLLVSKRTNLNLAQDYVYEQENTLNSRSIVITTIQNKIAQYQQELSNHHQMISNWQEMPIQQEDRELNRDLTFKSIGAKDNSLVDKLAKYFTLDSNELLIDAKSIINSARQYRQLLKFGASASSLDDLSNHDLQKKTDEHVATLKLGSGAGAVKERLRWGELSNLDQDLVLRSFLDKQELKELSHSLTRSNKLEKLILQTSDQLTKEHLKLERNAQQSNTNLTGNLGVMRDYLLARKRAASAYNVITELDSLLTSSKVVQLVAHAAEMHLGQDREFNIAKISSRSLANADFKQGQKYLEHLKNDKEIIAPVLHNNIIAYIMSSSREQMLAQYYQDAVVAGDELTAAQGQRQVAAAALVKQLDIVGQAPELNQANDNNDTAMPKLTQQLNLNINTIVKHAGLESTKHYFVKNDQGSNFTDNKQWQAILAIVSASNSAAKLYLGSELRDANKLLLTDINNSRELLASKRQESVSVKSELQDKEWQLETIERLKQSELPRYLSTIYRQKPAIVIENLDNMLSKSQQPELLARAIGHAPEMLGAVKSTGLWASLMQGREVRGIKANLENLSNLIITYVKGQEMRERLQQELDSGGLVAKINELDAEINALRLQLPTMQQQQFIDDINQVFEHQHQGKITPAMVTSNLSKIFASDNGSNILLEQAFDQNKKSKALAGKTKNKNTLQMNRGAKKNQQMTQFAIMQQIKIQRLDYQTVKDGLTSSHFEQIFRAYAPKINADGKIVKRGSNSISCGSLHLNLANGLWNRFSNGSKGDIFSFVEQATGHQKYDALLIVADIAGIRASDTSLNIADKQTHDQSTLEQKMVQSGFIAHEVIPKAAPKLNIKQHLSWLTQDDNKVDAIWTYRNIEGEALGGTIRVIDGKTGKKQILPVAYCYNADSGEEGWRLKGFLDKGYKPIYGAQKLRIEHKPVLIVEGEKTADKAQLLLPEYTVLSWLGGAQSTSKVNWGQLAGREVAIWPDNDIAGKEAARSILFELNSANGFSGLSSIVDVGSLHLPAKWDLADALPAHLDLPLVKEAIKGSKLQIQGIDALQFKEEDQIIEHNLASRQNNNKQYWQQVAIGVNLNREATTKVEQSHNVILRHLQSSDVSNYMEYAIARGIDESVHPFLSYSDGLYREILSSTIINHCQNTELLQQSKVLQAVYEQDSDNNVENNSRQSVELLKEGQNLYEQKSTNKTSHEIESLEAYKFDQEQLAANSGQTKAVLHAQLMQDFSYLHKEQLSMKGLDADHIEKLSHDLSRIITNYSLYYKGSERSMTDSDRRQIAQLAHGHINTKDWWQSLAATQIKTMQSQEHKLAVTSKSQDQFTLMHQQIEIAKTTPTVIEVISNYTKTGYSGHHRPVPNQEIITERALGHILEYMYASKQQPLAQEEVNSMVVRAAFEESKYDKWQNTVSFFEIEHNIDRVEEANNKIQQQRTTEQLVSYHGYLYSEQDKHAMNNDAMVSKVTFAYNNDLYNKEAASLLEGDKRLSGLKGTNPLAAQYLAENIVEFKHSYSEEMLTESRITLMQQVAISQARAHVFVENQMRDTDNAIIGGEHQTLKNNYLNSELLEQDRQLTAQSAAKQVGHDLTGRLLSNTHHEFASIHEHHDLEHAGHNMTTHMTDNAELNHDYHNHLHVHDYHALDIARDYHHVINQTIQQTRDMQHDYHQEMHDEHTRQISVNNDIQIGY